MPDTMMSPETLGTPHQSASIAALAGALALAQKAFAPIPKDREVTVHSDRGSYKFKYATLDAIRSATMPALAEQKLALVQGMTEQGNGYAVETKLIHESGEWIRNITPMFVSGRVKDGRQYPPTNQELGSAQSYARRYGLSALLCITADEDDDGNTADGNHIAGSERVPHKPGPSGSASGGRDFRPAGPRTFKPNNGAEARAEAQRDGLIDPNKKKPAPGAPAQRGATKVNDRENKIKEATDKRISALKSVTGWTRPTLDQFWADNKTWIDWMADPANEALAEYERFTAAFADAEVNMRETA